jgi:hypothetical protein
MRVLFALCLLLAPAPALAQEEALAEATTALSANWRPVTALTNAAFQSACTGADEEIAAVDAGLPETLSAETLASVRSQQGVLIAPADGEPGEVFLFAPPSMQWLTSGLARVSVIDASEGFLAIEDAAGTSIALQRGSAGNRPILRIRGPGNEVVNLVGCAPIL